MVSEPNSKKSKILKVLGIIFAWLSLPVLGILLLFITSYSSTVYLDQAYTLLALNGVLGVILILILLVVTYRFRRKSYFGHLRIGLYIGLGLYALILVIGIAVSIGSSIGQQQPSACTTPNKQYMAHSSAIVPIATNLGTGTGFAVSDGKTILTAYHVIDGAKKIYANYSSGAVNLKLLDKAPQYDLALLKIEKPLDTYFSLSKQYAVTDEVLVYGYPSNSLTAGPPSISSGIISRVVDLASLRLTQQNAPQGLEIVQTDAAINPGNSGGPMIGKCGVVGIVSFISDTSQLHDYIGSVSEQNIGFAISSKTAAEAFPKYLKLEDDNSF